MHLLDDSPLLFETGRNRLDTIRAVLARTAENERDFLLANPQHLGIRYEAHLAGEAPEWFAEHGFLTDADRVTLGQIAHEVLAGIAA